MFVMLRGSAAVSVARNGAGVRVGVMRQGDLFGEFSLLTGEARSATIRAEADCEVLEISQPVMAVVLRESPECLTALSEHPGEAKARGRRDREGCDQAARPRKKETRVSLVVSAALADGF